MEKLKCLNLYAGLGGNRKLWQDVEVTAVEWDEQTAKVYQDYFPDDEVIVADAHQYLLDHYKEFDFIWSSPPCPTHSKLNNLNNVVNEGSVKYPDMKLYQEIIFLNQWFGGKFCIENVIPYYEPLIAPTSKIHRHLYWSNFKIGKFNGFDKDRKHMKTKTVKEVYGFDVSNSNIQNKSKALRNMVDPAIGNYILDRARDIIIKSDTEQTTLF